VLRRWVVEALGVEVACVMAVCVKDHVEAVCVEVARVEALGVVASGVEALGVEASCYVSAGMFTRLGLCRLLYDKALVSRVLRLSYKE
jgi:hypothetical protein